MSSRSHTFLAVLLLYARLSQSKQCTYDPYISCPGPALGHFNGLPEQYSETTYSSSLALCSGMHGAPQNVGCVCTSSGGRLHCDESMADSTLYNAPLTFRDGTIHDHCLGACYCMRTSFMTTRGAYEPEATEQPMAHSAIRSPNAPNTAGPNPFSDEAGRPFDFDNDRFRYPFPPPTRGSVTSDQCGAGCTTNEDCEACAQGTTSANNYTCRAAEQSTFNPAVGIATFVSICLRSALLTGKMGMKVEPPGKRDLELPCPCNSTYVSHGCCAAAKGLVWEPAEAKLGELVDKAEKGGISRRDYCGK